MDTANQIFCVLMFAFFAFCFLLQKAGKAAIGSSTVRKAAGRGAVNFLSRLFK